MSDVSLFFSPLRKKVIDDDNEADMEITINGGDEMRRFTTGMLCVQFLRVKTTSFSTENKACGSPESEYSQIPELLEFLDKSQAARKSDAKRVWVVRKSQ